MRSWLRRPAVVHVLVALGCAMVTVLVLSVSGHPLRPVWFVAVAFAAAAVSLAFRELGHVVLETVWPQRDDEGLLPRGGESRVQFVSTWLQESTRNPEVFRRRLRPMVLDIVRSRLRHRRAVDPDLEPDAARAIAGEWLWDLMTDSPDRVLTYDELTRLVDEVERL